ncbi:MAG TPA: 1,2-phenylacetyl-CoA epoxidase subunit PaaD [Candidatus Limnocylindrales bacterium]|nr:1,2-phenylacetyl-CoA epoxidase subunit PaaD [Candidatus Limnocylindrales bacterium]
MIGLLMGETAVRAALAEVPDPELPVASIVDLGMVHRVEVTGEAIRVELLPTFVGCPALEAIRSAVRDRLAGFGRPVDIAFTFVVPWTSDRISPAGLERLRSAGIAPPTAPGVAPACPWCGSGDATLDNLFGPTQCRSVHFCRACRQPFEALKRV